MLNRETHSYILRFQEIPLLNLPWSESQRRVDHKLDIHGVDPSVAIRVGIRRIHFDAEGSVDGKLNVHSFDRHVQVNVTGSALVATKKVAG